MGTEVTTKKTLKIKLIKDNYRTLLAQGRINRKFIGDDGKEHSVCIQIHPTEFPIKKSSDLKIGNFGVYASQENEYLLSIDLDEVILHKEKIVGEFLNPDETPYYKGFEIEPSKLK